MTLVTLTSTTVIEDFLAYLEYEVNASACTVKAYGTDLRQFGEWLGGTADKTVDWPSVTLQDVRAWLAHLGGLGLCARTMRRKVIAVRSFFHWMRWRGLTDVNPATDLSLPKLPKPLPRLMKTEELEALTREEDFDTEDWRGYRDRLIIDFLYSTGLRRSELLGLMDSDVRTAEGEVKVLGKRRKVRLVPLAPQLCRRVERYRKLRDAALREAGRDGDGHFMLSNRFGPLNNSALSRIVQIELASLPGKRTPHTLRHTFATALLRDGAEINSVKELLGHSSLATTQIYTHLSFSELQHNYKLAHPRAAKNEHHGSKD